MHSYSSESESLLYPHCRHQHQEDTLGSCRGFSDVQRMIQLDQCPAHLWTLLFRRQLMIPHDFRVHCQSHVNPSAAIN